MTLEKYFAPMPMGNRSKITDIIETSIYIFNLYYTIDFKNLLAQTLPVLNGPSRTSIPVPYIYRGPLYLHKFQKGWALYWRNFITGGLYVLQGVVQGGYIWVVLTRGGRSRMFGGISHKVLDHLEIDVGYFIH